MTDDEIKAMAYAAGKGETVPRKFNADLSWLLAFARMVEAAERKRSADVADSLLLGMPGHTAPHPIYLYRGNVGAAIRGA